MLAPFTRAFALKETGKKEVYSANCGSTGMTGRRRRSVDAYRLACGNRKHVLYALPCNIPFHIYHTNQLRYSCMGYQKSANVRTAHNAPHGGNLDGDSQKSTSTSESTPCAVRPTNGCEQEQWAVVLGNMERVDLGPFYSRSCDLIALSCIRATYP